MPLKKTPKRRPTRVIYALQYDAVTDFEPIGLLAHAPMLLVVNKAIPADYLNEFIAWLKANPDKASSGPPEPAVRLTC